MTQISEYFAKIRFVIDKSEVKKVEAAFKDLEKKLKGSTKVLSEEVKAKKQSSDVSKVKASAVEKEVKAVDKLTKAQERLNKALSPAQVAKNRSGWLRSSRNIELKSGYGSQYRLGEQLNARKALELKQSKELADAEAKLKQQALDKERKDREQKERDSIKRTAKAHAEALSDNRIFDADIKRRQQAEDKRRQAEQKLLERKERMERQREERFRKAQSRNSRSNYLSAGGGSAAFMRYGVASLPLIGGMYGLASLNKANQELMSAEMANKATLGDQGQRSLDWLRNQANTIGFNYLDQLPIFTNFMASGTPLMGYDQSRDIFSSMTQFGMTRGATSDSMKRAMYAVSQMAAKGQVTTEELKSQLSEARGFGESRTIFAEAYQRLTGGNATGEEAASALIEAMGKGNVKSRDILPIVAQLMKEKAAGGIAVASRTSAAEQNRFANALTDLTRVFGQSGGERGFANLFQGFTSNANASTSLVEGLARGFESVAASLERVLSLSESFKNAIEGNDSQVADWLGADKVEQLKADWFTIKESIKDIFNMDSAGPSWLQRMTETIQTLINSIAELFRTLGGTKNVLSDIWEKHGGFGKPDGLANSVVEGGGYLLGAGFDAVRRLGANAIQTGVNMIPFASSSVAAPYANNIADMIRPTGKGADQQYWDTRYSELPAASKEMALDSIARGRYNNGEFTPATATNQNTFNMQFTITGGTEGTEDWFRHSFQNVLNETLPNYARSAQ